MLIAVAPVLHCLPGGKLTRVRRAQRCIHYLFRLFIGIMRFLGVLTYEVDRIERLRHARLVLANHPSLLDVVFLISLAPNANCIVKGPLTRNFFTRGPVTAAGYIINETADAVIDAAARAFSHGQCVIVFPEGTRTTPNQPMKLKRGAANVALRSGSDITPVLIYCKPTTLTKNEPWYQVPPRRIHFRILVRDQIPISQYSNLNPSVGARRLTSDLARYFDKELRAHE